VGIELISLFENNINGLIFFGNSGLTGSDSSSTWTVPGAHTVGVVRRRLILGSWVCNVAIV